jgi:phospholipid/cholesterol/gamma-HCH transport system substrate-binding protein
MFTNNNELKVGFLALIAFLILYFGFNFLKGNDLFSSSKTYYVQFENVDGLMPSNQVMVNGVEVGKVKKVSLDPEKGNKIVVELRVNKSLNIPSESLAILSDGALLGGKIIRLELKGTTLLPDGSTIKSMTEKGLTSLLKERALPVLSNADSLLISFRQISKKFEHTGMYLDALLKNSNQTVSHIDGSVQSIVADNKANLAQITGNMKALSQSLTETEKQIKPLLVKFNTVADSIQAIRIGETLQQANAAVGSLQRIVSKLEKGQGSAGKLLVSDSLYNGLNKSLIDLDKLLIDFRVQPKRYIHFSVFGKKNTAPTPEN